MILGGGRRSFVGRTDGRDLIQEWIDRKQQEGRSAEYVNDASEFRAVDPHDTDYLFGKYRLFKNLCAIVDLPPSVPDGIEILNGIDYHAK